MFVCAFDVRSSSLRMILTVKDPVPIFLEGRYYRLPVKSERVLNHLQEWSRFYRQDPDYLIGCKQDNWSNELEEALLNTGYRIRWVDRNTVNDLVKCRLSFRPDTRWLVGGLMTYLCDSDRENPQADDFLRARVLEWMYSTLRFQIMELEGELYVEGCLVCPGHLSPRCPSCDYGYDIPESEEPYSAGRSF